MNRVEFIDSIQGIEYPRVLVDFFDHFIALKEIVQDYGSIKVLNTNTNSITFSIQFTEPSILNVALNALNSLNGFIVIYGRSISIGVEILTDSELKITLI